MVESETQKQQKGLTDRLCLGIYLASITFTSFYVTHGIIHNIND